MQNAFDSGIVCNYIARGGLVWRKWVSAWKNNDAIGLPLNESCRAIGNYVVALACSSERRLILTLI